MSVRTLKFFLVETGWVGGSHQSKYSIQIVYVVFYYTVRNFCKYFEV